MSVMIDVGPRIGLILLLAAAALPAASGGAAAQLAGLGSGSPVLGVPAAPTASPVHIPLGATALGTGGLSPLPGAASPATAPLGGNSASTMDGLPSTMGTGLSPAPMAPWGSGTGSSMTGSDLGGMQVMPGLSAGAVP